jgi:hypothetical protein
MQAEPADATGLMAPAGELWSTADDLGTQCASHHRRSRHLTRPSLAGYIWPWRTGPAGS